MFVSGSRCHILHRNKHSYVRGSGTELWCEESESLSAGRHCVTLSSLDRNLFIPDIFMLLFTYRPKENLKLFDLFSLVCLADLRNFQGDVMIAKKLVIISHAFMSTGI